MSAARKTIFKNFTIVELLLVLAIMGILLAASLAAFPAMFGKQGLVGSVRTLSSKVSMARSYAVTQNRNVALLLPDKTANTSGAGTNIANYVYNYTRLCYVDSNNNFDGWIDGEEWYLFANGVCAYIESPAAQAAPLPAPPAGGTYTVQRVTALPGGEFSSAVIFQNNGSLLNSGNVVIRVNSAFYDKNTTVLSFNVKGGTIEQKRWNIVITPFTGKAKYLYGTQD
ncbi:MAG: GspH/FimT family pseudopilin [Patescibacteria group bacterium]|jgi:type II secretory pathway pseudopilin PulG